MSAPRIRQTLVKLPGYFYLIWLTSMLVGRNHFLFGSALNIGNWLWLIPLPLFFIHIRRNGYTAKMKMATVLLLLLILNFCWPLFHQASLREPENISQTFRIVSYNLFFKNKQPHQSLAVIQDSIPEILVLQEVTPDWENHLNKAFNARNRRLFSRCISLKGTHGLAVYSKYPILSDTVLCNKSNRPVAQLVEIVIGKKHLLVINTHLASPGAAVEQPENFLSHYASSYRHRTMELEALDSVINQRYPHIQSRILAGDLNTLQVEPLFRDLRYNWVNVFDAIGIKTPKSFPNSSGSGPLITIDYVLLQGSIQAMDAKVVPGGSSDHLALWAKLGI